MPEKKCIYTVEKKRTERTPQRYFTNYFSKKKKIYYISGIFHLMVNKIKLVVFFAV